MDSLRRLTGLLAFLVSGVAAATCTPEQIQALADARVAALNVQQQHQSQNVLCGGTQTRPGEATKIEIRSPTFPGDVIIEVWGSSCLNVNGVPTWFAPQEPRPPGYTSGRLGQWIVKDCGSDCENTSDVFQPAWTNGGSKFCRDGCLYSLGDGGGAYSCFNLTGNCIAGQDCTGPVVRTLCGSAGYRTERQDCPVSTETGSPAYGDAFDTMAEAQAAAGGNPTKGFQVGPDLWINPATDTASTSTPVPLSTSTNTNGCSGSGNVALCAGSPTAPGPPGSASPNIVATGNRRDYSRNNDGSATRTGGRGYQVAGYGGAGGNGNGDGDGDGDCDPEVEECGDGDGDDDGDGDGDGASGGRGCALSDRPVCDMQQAACLTLVQTWELRCMVAPGSFTPPSENPTVPDVFQEGTQVVNLDRTRLGSTAGTCPVPASITLPAPLSQTLTLPQAELCGAMSVIKPILLTFALVIAVRILTRSQ